MGPLVTIPLQRARQTAVILSHCLLDHVVVPLPVLANGVGGSAKLLQVVSHDGDEIDCLWDPGPLSRTHVHGANDLCIGPAIW